MNPFRGSSPDDSRDLPASGPSVAGIRGVDSVVRLLLDATDHPALVLDEEGRVVAASQALFRDLGLDGTQPVQGLGPGELLGCHWATRDIECCGGAAPCADCGIRRVLQDARTTEGPAACESPLSIQRDRTGRLDEFRCRAITFRLGAQAFRFLSLQDLGDRKRRASMERFFFHQVLNLAEALEGTVRILAAAPESAPMLIHQLMDFSEQLSQEIRGQRILLQAENGSLQVETRTVELSELLESLRACFRNHDVAHKRHLELPACPPERFQTDPTLLLRILMDLLMNAFEATPAGGRVQVDYRRTDGWREFTVHNPGTIAPAVAEGIFQRGFSSKPSGGWGLGTFGLKLLAERYLLGELRFTSGEREGTAFTLRLPAPEPLPERLPQPEPETAPTVPAGPVAAGSVPTGPVAAGLGTVLVADDTKVTRHLIHSILSRDFRVLLAEDGPEALALARECRPDLVVLDVIMPGMDGFSVCRQLKKDPRTRGIPIIFLTSLAGQAHETQALEAGAIDFISKPINPDVVLARVRNHLGMKKAQDQLKDLSLQDGLTGIANRRAFDQALEHEWRRGLRSHRPLSVIMGDVDFFKRYNDALGHSQGDACLRCVAQVFAAAVQRPSDTVARYGGEEFICILGDTHAEGARVVAEKIRTGIEALALPHPDSGIGNRVTVSLGIASVIPDHRAGSLALVDAADRQLYEAKRNGRNRVSGPP